MKLTDLKNSISFCFLNAVYITNEEEDWVYEVVMTDYCFSDVWLYRCKIDKIPELLEVSAITDFEFEDEFFKCSSEVAVYEINNLVKNSVGQIHLVSETRGTIYKFLTDGVMLDYMFYDEVNGTEIFTPFYKLQFSHSTMTVFYKLIDKGTIENKSVITWENMIWKAKTIQFASRKPISDPGFQFVKNTMFNRVEYYVYECTSERIVTDFSAIPEPILNKAALQAVRAKSGALVLQEYCSDLYRVVNNEERFDESLVYSGSGYRHPGYGVYVKPTAKLVSKKRAKELLQFVQTGNDVESTINNGNDFIERWILSLVSSIHHSYDVPVARLGCLIETRITCEKLLMLSEMFLYRMRVFSYSTRTPLTNGRNTSVGLVPIIHGSDEPGSCLIEGGFYHDGFSN